MYNVFEVYELANFYELFCSEKEKFILYSKASDNKKVYGPYRKSDGRQIVIIKDINGTRTVSFPKYIMEEHLGRELHPDKETVDHIDFNFKKWSFYQ